MDATRHKQIARLLFGLTAMLSLAGCTGVADYFKNGFKVGPNYARPPAPVETDWIDQDQRISRSPAELRDWWRVFNDPVLNSLIDSAFQQNLTLREAGFRVLQARANLRITRGNILPQQQDAFGAYSRNAISVDTANSFSGIPIPGFPGIDRFFNQYDLGFGLAWELDFWGRFRRAIEAADDDLDASVENYDDVLVTLLADVASTYVQIRTLEQQLVYTRANVALQQKSLEIAQARFKGGLVSQLDPDQAQSNLGQTQATVPVLEIQLRQAENQLCILLGIPPENLRAKLGDGSIPTAPVEVAIGIPADLLTRRPDIRRAEREAAAQSARIGVAASELYPHISITGSIGWSAEKFSDLLGNRSFNGTVGPSFQWNILNYGRLINNVRLQDARFMELVVRYQNQVLEAGQEVENGLVAFLKSQEQVRYQAESVKYAVSSNKIVLVQFEGGQVDFNRVVVIQQDLVGQQNLLAQAQGNIAQGLIEVFRALGGGWQIRLDQACGAPAPVPVAVPEGERLPIAPTPVDPPKNPAPAPAPAPAEEESQSPYNQRSKP